MHCSHPMHIHKSGECSASVTDPICSNLINAVGLGCLIRAGHIDPHLPHCSQMEAVLDVTGSNNNSSLEFVISITFVTVNHQILFYLKGFGPSFCSEAWNSWILSASFAESSIDIPVR